MDYVTAHFMHKMSKHKKKEPQDKDVVMVLLQNNRENHFYAKTQSCAFLLLNKEQEAQKYEEYK